MRTEPVVPEAPMRTGGARSKPASKAELTRARLLRAAVETFANKGFHGTTTRDIASAANMSPAVVYVHFVSKEALLHVIATDGHRGILEMVRGAHGEPGLAAERLESAIRVFATDHAEDSALGRVVNHELKSLSPEHLSEISEMRREIAALIRGLIEEGVKEGEFSTRDPAMAATMIMSACIDVARWYRRDGEWTPADVGDFYAEAALRLVGHEASGAI